MRGLKKILVIDDNSAARQLCRELFFEGEYAVEYAKDCGDGLLQFRKSAFDFVIVDTNATGSDGRNFLESTVPGLPRLKRRFLFVSGAQSISVLSSAGR